MSTGTTPKGLVYPNGDDPLASGDDRIKALATALDPTYLQVVSSANVTAATPPNDAKIPVGWSQLGPMSGAEASAGGWPSGGSTLLTHKGTSVIANQLLWRNSGGRTTLWTRCGSTTWGPWAVLESLGGVNYGQAIANPAALPVVNLATNPTARVAVTFPAGLFAVVPNIFVQSQSSAWVAAPYSPSASSFQIEARSLSGAAGGGTLAIWWSAIA